MLSQTTEYDQNNQTTRTSSRFFGEKINLGANGYVYHPRFFVFFANVAEGLNQARATDTGSQSASTTDYQLRTTFLAEHPYNLQLFALHHESVNQATFLQGPTDKRDDRGAEFRYVGRPFSFTTNYQESNSESTVSRMDSRSYRANAHYFGSMSSDSASYSHNETVSSLGIHTTHEGSGFSNGLRFLGGSLDSEVGKSVNDQTSRHYSEFQTSVLNWTERLTMPLPWNFLARASYGYEDDENRIAEDQSSPVREDFNRSSNRSFNLNHRLYQSLNTNYSLNDIASKSSMGEVTARSESLGSTYTKTIPAAVLTAGFQVSRMDAERLGLPVILNEPHTAALFGSFLLAQQNVIESTIVVQIKDPASGGFMTMPSGNYLLSRPGSDIQLTIQSVSPATLQPNPAYAYEFRVSYSLSDESKFLTTTEAYSLRLDFLDNILSVYYSYYTSNQELESGAIAGGPEKSSGETEGMICQVDSYNGSLEHQRTWSTHSPFESWKAAMGYRTPYSEDTTLSAQLSYTITDYFPSTSLQGVGTSYEQKSLGTNVSLNKNFAERKLNFFITGSYSATRAQVNSDMLSLNSYLAWQIGLLSINTGAQVTRSASQTSAGTASMISESVYLTLSRKLF